MKKEFIEKLIELAEGFTIEKRIQHEEWYIRFGDKVVVDYVFREYDQEFDANEVMYFVKESGFYPTLLYRALETWNERHIEAETGNAIWINPSNIRAIVFNDEIVEVISDYKSEHKADKYLTAKEKALEAVLMEVLK